MRSEKKVRVALNGYGVIGKRVAEAVTRQDDMTLVGVCDVATDWRMRIATRKVSACMALGRIMLRR